MQITSDRTVTVWRCRLGEAFRITLACSMVGCFTLYGPTQLRRQVAYPAFSYVTAILIVSGATLGDALRGTWQALVGTSLVMGPAILSLWLVGPAHFNREMAAVVVALGAFGVALPKSTPLMSKRIAFGQMSLVYVGAAIHGGETQVVMHPFHVAASTSIGALASVLAMLIPFPRLATLEIRKQRRLYSENASERLNLLLKAFVSKEIIDVESLAEAKTLSERANKILQKLHHYQEGMQWEKPKMRLMATKSQLQLTDKLQEVEIALKGMEMALAAFSKSTKNTLDKQIKDELGKILEQINLNLKQVECSLPQDNELIIPFNIELTHQNMPLFFYLFCIKNLSDGSSSLSDQQMSICTESNEEKQDKNYIKRILRSLLPTPSHQSMVFSLKCALSLGLAVFFGLSYNKQNGYWSGLTIAISFNTWRHATFTVANARAMGTAMGSVYGVLGCYIFHKYTELKLLALLPWIIFTTFLRHSKMYGEAGSISAVIGALLILGRKNYGTPSEFAIARITESFIGLFCLIVVEVILQPERAAVLAEVQLSKTITTLTELIKLITLPANNKKSDLSSFALQEKHRKLKTEIIELKKLIEEAKVEPNFWFIQFQAYYYNLVSQSLERMACLSYFMGSSVELLCQELQKSSTPWREDQKQLPNDFELYKKTICASLASFEEDLKVKSPSSANIEKGLEKHVSHVIEMGKQPNANGFQISDVGKEDIESTLSSILSHARDLNHTVESTEHSDIKKKNLGLIFGSLGFCMRSLTDETREIERVLKELACREKPST